GPDGCHPRSVGHLLATSVVTASGLVTVIQARIGSTRMPGKVLLPLGDRTVLEQLWLRVTQARLCGTVVVATTTDSADDAIVALCARADIPCLRGHPTDLLDRHIQAARWVNAAYVAKIPSDCPLISPEVIDEVIGFYLDGVHRLDYVSNLHPQSYP